MGLWLVTLHTRNKRIVRGIISNHNERNATSIVSYRQYVLRSSQPRFGLFKRNRGDSTPRLSCLLLIIMASSASAWISSLQLFGQGRGNTYHCHHLQLRSISMLLSQPPQSTPERKGRFFPWLLLRLPYDDVFFQSTPNPGLPIESYDGLFEAKWRL